MKRFHVHVGVTDLDQAIGFYSMLFAASPTVVKADYAKWMLEDPRVNFAISTRDKAPGIEHLGIQVENEAELDEVYDRLARAERPVVEEKGITCCYAESDKQWIADPAGVAWETFLTHGEATVYGQGTAIARLNEAATACCEPRSVTAVAPASTCCAPAPVAAASVTCCAPKVA